MNLSKKHHGWGKETSAIRQLSEYGRKRKAQIGKDKVFDFSLGSPSIPPPPLVTETIEKLVAQVPAQDLHAYTSGPGDLSFRQAIADYIQDKFQAQADPNLIYVATGAAAGLAMTFQALTSSDQDEILSFSPYFPEYKVFVENAGAKFTTALCDMETMQADLDRLEKAISENTKALILNQPNNPTGVVFEEEVLKGILEILEAKQEEYGHPIYLVSDEPYREISYEKEIPYYANLYDNTIVIYSFSKSLSLPGERIGYVFVSPRAQDAQEVFYAISGAGRGMGYVCAPSLFQQVMKECLGQTSDLKIYQENRDLLYSSLLSYGFEPIYPNGAFYLFVKTPISDAEEFSEKAKDYELLLVPSNSFGCEGYVRISYCVSPKQIRASLPAFQRLAEDFDL